MEEMRLLGACRVASLRHQESKARQGLAPVSQAGPEDSHNASHSYHTHIPDVFLMVSGVCCPSEEAMRKGVQRVLRLFAVRLGAVLYPALHSQT